MRKIFCAALLVILLAVPSYSLERLTITLGLLDKLNSTEERFAEAWKASFAPHGELLQVNVKFYSTLTAMQMALNAGEIAHMVLPEPSAQYLMNTAGGYDSVLVLRSKGMGLAFGFREDSKALRDEFNAALSAMRDNWVLAALEGAYITAPGKDDPQPVKFTEFPGADTIRVAVTGDLPPIDFIAADGTPAGYNTAVLAEIGRHLKKNIELLDIDSGARSAALASGRVDAVFWYEVEQGTTTQHDIPDGVIVSDPYYEWDRFIHLRRHVEQKSEWSWDFSPAGFFKLYLGGKEW